MWIRSGRVETIHSEYIDLGPYNILSPRELEVFVMLGHGLKCPSYGRDIASKRQDYTNATKRPSPRSLVSTGKPNSFHFVTQMGLDLKDTRSSDSGDEVNHQAVESDKRLNQGWRSAGQPDESLVFLE